MSYETLSEDESNGAAVMSFRSSFYVSISSVRTRDGTFF